MTLAGPAPHPSQRQSSDHLPACSSPYPCLVTAVQWHQYERKVAQRTAEQQSALSKSSSLGDTMRRRFAPSPDAALATPHPTADGVPPVALHMGLLAGQLFGSSGAAAAQQTPLPSTVGSLKENLGPSFNQSALAAGSAAGSKRSSMTGMAEPDSQLQEASSAFLQQVEEMRRKYTAEVEALKADVTDLSLRRDALAAEAQSAGASAKALQAQVAAAQQELEEVTRDLGRAQARLASLEEARRAEQQRYEAERAATTQELAAEAAAQRERLAAERTAAEAAARQAEAAAQRHAGALEQRAARIEEQARGLVERDAELQQKELEFEGQVGVWG